MNTVMIFLRYICNEIKKHIESKYEVSQLCFKVVNARYNCY